MNELWQLVLLRLAPSYLMIYLAADIYRRNPNNGSNRLTALLVLSFSMLFLGDFLLLVLPAGDAVWALWNVKYPASFATMSLALYFASSLSVTFLPRWLRHAICLAPFAAAAVTVLRVEGLGMSLAGEGYRKVVRLNVGMATLVAICVMYTLIWFFVFLVPAWRRSRVSPNVNERKRIRIILFGTGIACLYIVAAILIDAWLASKNVYRFNELSSYGILIWAFFVRYAMAKFDFLASRERPFQVLFEISHHGIVLLNEEAKLIEANPAFLGMVGQPDGLKDGFAFQEILPVEQRIPFQRAYREAFESLAPMESELEIVDAEGRKIWVEFKSDYLEKDGRMLCYVVLRDATEDKRREQMLLDLAYNDALTGIYNRRKFMQVLEQAVAAANAERSGLTVMIIDMDGFKEVNDEHGHSAGDALLKEVAERLEACLPPMGIAARLGGDEFAAIIPGTAGEPEIRETAERMIQGVRKAAEKLGGNTCFVSASVGVARLPHDGNDVEDLLKHADMAMYEAKKAGKNRYRLYESQVAAKEPE